MLAPGSFYYPSVFKYAIAYSRILLGINQYQPYVLVILTTHPFPLLTSRTLVHFWSVQYFQSSPVLSGIVDTELAGQVGGATSRR